MWKVPLLGVSLLSVFARNLVHFSVQRRRKGVAAPRAHVACDLLIHPMMKSFYGVLMLGFVSPCNSTTLQEAITKIRKVPQDAWKTVILGFLLRLKDTNADTTREDLFAGDSHPDGPLGFPSVHFFKAWYLCDYSVCICCILPMRRRQGGLAMRERRRDLVFPWSFFIPFICRIRRQPICELYLLKGESNGS